jgi:hypothetical protein
MGPDPDTGAVPRDTVLQVLYWHHVEIIQNDPHTPGKIVLIKGDKIDAREIYEWVERDILQYFKREFGVPMAHFYHPELAKQYWESKRPRTESAPSTD